MLDAVGLPLAAAVEVADAAAAGGRRALALAAVDRVAMGLTTGRRITQPDRADDPAKRDPEQMADLLVRAGRAARAAGSPPRAAALCRTAAEMLERAGDLRGARRAFAIAAAALRADDQPDLAASLAGRMRKLAQGDGDAQDEAIAMTIVAEVMADRGDLPKAIHLHKEAAKLLHQAGDRGGALDHTAALALLYERKGDVDGARKTLAAAADQAAKAELTPLARRLRQAEAELCLRAGQVGVAIEAAEQLHASFEPGDDPRGRARAGACLARILTVVGAGERAAEVLAGGDPHLASPEDVALALRARAGVARAAGHPTEATGLLTNAAALLGKGSPLFGELLLEAAELTAEDEATHPATRAALRRLEQAGALPPASTSASSSSAPACAKTPTSASCSSTTATSAP